MKNHIYYCLLVLGFASAPGFSAPDKTNYWQCSTQDSTHKKWTAQNTYQKMAINISFDACKKESQTPSTCKASKSGCEAFIQGVSISPLWRCTALDRTAMPWPSNLYSQRDDAALAAKDYCKANSTIPETCYINMVTCRNLNEGAVLK